MLYDLKLSRALNLSGEILQTTFIEAIRELGKVVLRVYPPANCTEILIRDLDHGTNLIQLDLIQRKALLKMRRLNLTRLQFSRFRSYLNSLTPRAEEVAEDNRCYQRGPAGPEEQRHF